MMRAKEVVLEPEENSDQGRQAYMVKDSVTEAVFPLLLHNVCVKRGADPDKFNIEKCSGAAECKKALTLLKVGKLPADFIEGMVCEGGCVGGPSRHRSGKNPVLAAKDRDKLLAEADNRNVSDNLSKYDLTAFSMHK
ncbi:MAG: [Fe-Fe] hydrogenase large subunit C-terminal domain-containing protein [Lachnospira eligens]